MPAREARERWVNREEKGREGLYRVEVPGHDPLLVRADTERQAAELAAAEAAGQVKAADLLERGSVEPLTCPKVTVHDGKHPTSGNPPLTINNL